MRFSERVREVNMRIERIDHQPVQRSGGGIKSRPMLPPTPATAPPTPGDPATPIAPPSPGVPPRPPMPLAWPATTPPPVLARLARPSPVRPRRCRHPGQRPGCRAQCVRTRRAPAPPPPPPQRGPATAPAPRAPRLAHHHHRFSQTGRQRQYSSRRVRAGSGIAPSRRTRQRRAQAALRSVEEGAALRRSGPRRQEVRP
jgi:hypothetical protein